MTDTCKEDKERELLLETYKLYMARYNAIFPMVYADVKMYAWLNTLVIGATGGAIQTGFHNKLGDFGLRSPWWLVAFSSLALMLFSFLGWEGTKKSYSAWLRSITTLAKLEFKLRLWEAQDWSFPNGATWQKEPIIWPGHVSDFKDSTSSKDYQDRSISNGYGLLALYLFAFFGIIGGTGFVASVFNLICACR